jgi:hypothetical protein
MVAKAKITIFQAKMPQDTLYIINNQGDTFYTLTDSATQIGRMKLQEWIVMRNLHLSILPGPRICCVTYSSLFFLFVGLRVYIYNAAARRKERTLSEDMYRQYQLLLLSGSPYYRKLSEVLKRRFLSQRTYAFMASKDFHYVNY